MKKKVIEKQRRLGEFFTPTIWVDEAHKMISENLGADWKEKYVVWDPAWGTGNLTRDYKFKELYCSTIEASNIHSANQMGYNPEATKFQFDFLNEEDSALPKPLQDAINSGKEILFLITNGATQEQISQILNISRSTVSMIIGNQICPKFNIPGANTKILLKEAINAGFYRHMPPSLWKPCIIVLNEDLLDDPMLKEPSDN